MHRGGRDKWSTMRRGLLAECQASTTIAGRRRLREMEHLLTDDIGARLPDDIGARLRRAREHRRWSLADVARRTKLPIAVLQAIERNDFASLPGGMFRKAYVRTLAVEVGLDPNEIAADYCALFEPPIESPVLSRPVGLEQKLIDQLAPSRRRPIVTLMVLAAPAAVWFMLQSGTMKSEVTLDDVASELAAAVPRGTSMTLTADRPRDAAPTAIAAQATTTVPLRIAVAATGWCWVAADTDGERVMYRLMEPGERVVLEGQRMIGLRLGDAGSVTLSINGGASRSFGGDTQVVELQVTPDNVDELRDGTVRSASGG